MSAAIIHKTEVGGVALNVPIAEVRAKLETMAIEVKAKTGSTIEEFLIQEMASGGMEFMVGMHRDPLGTAILVGMGGVTAELFKDTNMRLLSPGKSLSEAEVLEMLQDLKTWPLLNGYRGRPQCDIKALVKTIVQFSAMVAALDDRLIECEINPIFVFPAGHGVKAADGIAVFPADTPFSSDWRKKANGRRFIDFALNGPAVVSGTLLADGRLEIKTSVGLVQVKLSVLGEHNVRNALAATAVALAAKVDLEAIRLGLESFQAVSGRMMASQLGACLLIDDSYNANPDSVRAAIDALSQASQKTCLVLGDMGEVGSKGPEFHYEVGAYAAERGIAHLWALGEQTQSSVRGFNEFNGRVGSSNAAIHFESIDALNARVATIADLFSEGASVSQPYAVLVKGSRFMRMERAVSALKHTLAEVKACS